MIDKPATAGGQWQPHARTRGLTALQATPLYVFRRRVPDAEANIA